MAKSAPSADNETLRLLPKFLDGIKISGWNPTIILDKEAVDTLVSKFGVFKKVKGEDRLVRLKDNRKPKEPRIKALVEDFLDGGWDRTGQGIIFSSREQMLDGQNRLIAMHRALQVNPKLKFEIDVQLGIDPQCFAKLDCGTPRSLTDAVHVAAKYQGENSTLFQEADRELAQLARNIYLRTHGTDLNGSLRLPPHKVMSFLTKDHPGAIEALSEVHSIIEQGPEQAERLKAAPNPYWALLIYLGGYYYESEDAAPVEDQESLDTAISFVSLFANDKADTKDIGNDEAAGPAASHPISRLRQALIKANAPETKMAPHFKFAMIVKAYLQWKETGAESMKPINLKPEDVKELRLGGMDLTADEYKELTEEQNLDEEHASEETTQPAESDEETQPKGRRKKKAEENFDDDAEPIAAPKPRSRPNKSSDESPAEDERSGESNPETVKPVRRRTRK